MDFIWSMKKAVHKNEILYLYRIVNSFYSEFATKLTDHLKRDVCESVLFSPKLMLSIRKKIVLFLF